MLEVEDWIAEEPLGPVLNDGGGGGGGVKDCE
jgi:hypothetical protein